MVTYSSFLVQLFFILCGSCDHGHDKFVPSSFSRKFTGESRVAFRGKVLAYFGYRQSTFQVKYATVFSLTLLLTKF